MGVVYRAFDETLEREVALKVLALEAHLDAESRRRFAVEAKAAAKLQHPTIVTVFELGEERGVPFIAMEFLSGADVDTLLHSEGTLLVEETLDVMAQVCRGLAYAHSHRIIHRDVKPSNVRLLDDGTAKLLDFGIAKLGELTLTQSGTVLGTVHYMSPEQVHGLPLDGRSDIFSAGVILYEMCTKTRPFTGRTAPDILEKILHHPAPPLPAHLRGSMPGLQAILDRALAKNVSDRYPTAAALADELTEARDQAAQADEHGAATEALAVVSRAEMELKRGRFDETIHNLTNLLDQNPRCLAARRALRAATRERARRRTTVAAAQDFPELLCTFGSIPVVEERTTETRPATPVIRRPAGNRSFLAMGAVLLLAGAAAAVMLLRETPRATDGDPTPVSLPATALTPSVTRLAAAETPRSAPAMRTSTVRIVSNPPGAELFLDGVAVKGVTPLSLRIAREGWHRIELRLAGHLPYEMKLAASEPIPQELHFDLRPVGPLTAVVIASSYPIDVLWRGRVMTRQQTSSSVELPRGRHALTITSPEHFLLQEVVVDVESEPVRLSTPALGRLNVGASPDNCDVFVDGIFADNPPIRGRQVASGAHVIEFRWPDGSRVHQTITVEADGVAYAFGRKEENP